MRTSIGISPAPPTRRIVFSCSVRRRLACVCKLISPISSSKQGAAVGLLEATAAHLSCTAECAALVPKQLGFLQRLGDAGAVDGHERTALALATDVDGARH